MIEWHTVSANENYEVSNDGQVRRVIPNRGAQAGRALKPRKHSQGYLFVSLYRNDKVKNHYIHRLVALAFLGNPPTPSHEVAHADGDPANNHFSNLRWATSKENQADKVIHGRTNRGERHGHSKLTESDVHEIRNLISQGDTQQDIAEKFGVSRGTISKIKRGRNWSWLNWKGK